MKKFLLGRLLVWLGLACLFVGSASVALCVASAASVVNPSLPRILHVNIADQTCGGAAEIVFSLSKKLIEKKYHVKVVASRGSYFHQELKKRDIPHIDIDVHWPSRAKDYSGALARALEDICKKERIDIINVHKPWEYDAARLVAKKLGIQVVAFYHSYEKPNPKKFEGFNAVFSVNPQIALFIRETNRSPKCVEFMNPPFDEGRLLNFVAHRDRQAFFRDAFGVEIRHCPIVCMIANYYPCKNHDLLLQAVHILVHQEHTPVQIMLAGSGDAGPKAQLERTIKRLGLEEYVHLLGYTKEIPELLFNADIAVLPSKSESFGIVVLEAAVMKKPIIVSKNCGVAGCFVEHGRNGLIIDPEDAQDLAHAIKIIVTDSAFALALGQQAFTTALMHFSTDAAIAKVEKVYRAISEK